MTLLDRQKLMSFMSEYDLTAIGFNDTDVDGLLEAIQYYGQPVEEVIALVKGMSGVTRK